jgi:hypothetical protein
MPGFEIAAANVQPFKDGQCRPARSQRRVLVRDRRAEDRHDPVASKALHGAALSADGVFHWLRQALHQRECSLFPGPFREGREADHVGEKDGDLPAFRLHPNSPLTGMQQRSITESTFDDSEAKGRVQINHGALGRSDAFGKRSANGRFLRN